MKDLMSGVTTRVRPRRGAVALGASVVLAGSALATSSALANEDPHTATPIKHLVVIFQENVSFDHYFGTYPTAANTDGQPFTAAVDTPQVNGLTEDLLTHNPNAANPKRLGGPGQQVTCDQDHEYTDEQLTANPHHLPPSSVDMIGKTDQANHQYDLSDFWAAADSGHLPSVSYLKAAGYQDGHAGYSDPIDEQQFLVQTINHLQELPEWKDTAVVIAYDDSDGWYDHQAPPRVNNSQSAQDALTAPGQCGPHGPMLGGYLGRCGYGPRLPLLVISPLAKPNYVDHTVTDQASILRFIEDNWHTGRIGNASFDTYAGCLTGMFDFDATPQPTLLLDPTTGQPTT
jgi:phospholipase C